MKIRDLPDDVVQVLKRLNAPPRLVAHLTLVHDVAVEILKAMSAQWPDLPIDQEAVLFGAATHDVGKVLHPAELTGSGNNHEKDGPELLERMGIPADRARFSRTHATWKQEATPTLEDFLVALADTCWKGERNGELEDRLASRIADLEGIEKWEVFLALDAILASITAHADERLAWQSLSGP